MPTKTSLQILADASDHYPNLRTALKVPGYRSVRIEDDLFFLDFLGNSHKLKPWTKDNIPMEITQLMQDFEVITQLLRHKKIWESKRLYKVLNEVTDSILKWSSSY